MVPEEWPIAPPVSRADSRVRRAGRGRLPVVRTDFFLDPAKRLTEQERALMTAMLADLIGGIADELSASLGPNASAANDEDGHQLLFVVGNVKVIVFLPAQAPSHDRYGEVGQKEGAPQTKRELPVHDWTS